jgi:histidinol-phosphate aminotransferase
MDARYASLEAYVPGEQYQNGKYIKLNTNESPYPPSPGVLALLSGEEGAGLNLYPDPEGNALRERLARFYGVERENVLAGNGSDELLSFAFMAFGGGGAVFPDVSYGFYPVYAELYGVQYRTIPLRADFSVNIDDYKTAGKMVVLANPNAPTGISLPLPDIVEITASNPDHVVLLDEAYVDFGGASAVGQTKRYDNLLVVQTYSKFRSMAGARLGYAIGSAGLIADLDKLKYSTNPYNVNRLTLALGAAALEEDDYYRQNGGKVMEVREHTAARLREMGFTVLPSCANFLFAAAPGMPGGELYARLKERGILVRFFSAKRTSEYVRVTIGSPEQMEAFLAAVRAILQENKNA